MVMRLDGGLCLTDDDRQALDELHRKLQVIKDAAVSVAKGLSTGMYVYGPGGCGKTHTVVHELKRVGAPYRINNSRMTGRGLFNTLKAYPDEIHVLDDMEQILRDRGAQGILRGALGTQGPTDGTGRYQRLVTWTTYFKEHSFIFTGGIIMLGNRPFDELPELAAVKTRIDYIQLQPTAKETLAMMRAISLHGYEHGRLKMTPEECVEVCEFIVVNSVGLKRDLDLRLLINGFRDYLQWQEVLSGCSWQDRVLTRIKERAVGIGEVQSVPARVDRKEREREIAREIRDLGRDERASRWRELTGKSEQTLYRRLAEIDGE